jgi:uncharacterized membrane protein
MKPQNYKVLVLVVTAVSALITASPALQHLLVFPQGESFTGLWLLGPGHMAEGYPYNVTSGQRYDVFLGVSNHLGHAAYYSVQVKFRNLTQLSPDSISRTSSSLPALYNVYAFVANNETWELPVTFGFDYSYDSSLSRVSFNRLLFNDEELGLGGYYASWDVNRTVFFGDLMFELWVYDDAVSGFQYHERYVDLKFNMTV